MDRVLTVKRALITVLIALAIMLRVTASAAAQETRQSSSNFLPVQMVALPGDSFTMGNTGATPGEEHEGPSRVVAVAPFAIGTFEVTQAQFEAVMGYNPSANRGLDKPAEQVSWYDAVRFCNALSERDGLEPAYEINPFQGYTLKPEANGYRLPTEVEWEYAAKAGTTTDTYAGDVTVLEGADPVVGEIAWYVGTAEGYTHAVGQKRPNAFGLYDMIGNVFEWTDAVFTAYAGGRLDSDMPGAADAERLKVLRGGALDTEPAASRASYRYRLHPSYTSYNIGFRIVRSLEK